jgi:nicotinate-nucleotide adenylyltransferase
MIGVFGGTFDPVHFGHLRPALEILEALALRQMRLVPSSQPPHRPEPIANGKQRETLLLAAIGKDTPGLVVDNRELKRPGPSYMVDTLVSLRQDGRSPLGEEPICLVLGMDAFLQLHTWHRWEEILQLAHVVVMHRPGWVAEEQVMPAELVALWRDSRIADAQQLREQPVGKILPIVVSQLDISSTRIRELVAAGKSPRFLLPDAVWNLIRLQSLYGVMNQRSDNEDFMSNERVE